MMPAQTEDAIRCAFSECEHPEDVAGSLEPFLRIIQQEAELTPTDWAFVFAILAADIEFRDGCWFQSGR